MNIKQNCKVMHSCVICNRCIKGKQMSRRVLRRYRRRLTWVPTFAIYSLNWRRNRRSCRLCCCFSAEYNCTKVSYIHVIEVRRFFLYIRNFLNFCKIRIVILRLLKMIVVFFQTCLTNALHFDITTRDCSFRIATLASHGWNISLYQYW